MKIVFSLAIALSVISAPLLHAQGNDPATKEAREGSEAAKAGDWDKAIEAFRKAYEMNHKWGGDLAAALQQRASASMKQNQFQEAQTDFTEALKIKPHDAGIHERRAYAEMKLGQMDQALADYNEAIKIDPKEIRYYQIRSYIYEQKKDYKNSLADTDRILKMDPNNAEAKARKDRINKIQELANNQVGATPIPAPPSTPTPSPTPGHKKHKG